jgi:hemoglobin-like flavoprotein
LRSLLKVSTSDPMSRGEPCMLATLSDVAGSAWTPALAKAWGDALNAVAGLMLAGAAKR